MSIWEALLVVGAMLAVLLFLASYYAYAGSQLLRLQRYEYWTDMFFAAAKPLVANRDTPPHIISLIENLNDIIADRSAPIGIQRVFGRRLVKDVDARTDPKQSLKSKEFFNENSDLVRNAEAVVHAGLLACTYASALGGVQARAILADVFSQVETRNFEMNSTQDVRDVAIEAHRGSGLVPLIMRR